MVTKKWYGPGRVIDLSDDTQSQLGPYTFCSIYSKELFNTMICRLYIHPFTFTGFKR